MMNSVSLDDMRLFVAAVQAGSLSKASVLTGVPVSRLSRRLTELETALGTVLADRGKKGLKLNELGLAFFERSMQMLELAQVAIDGVKGNLSQVRGRLKISATTGIANLFLADCLAQYLQRYPEVSLEIDLNQNKINMIQDGVDIALRIGSIENDNVVAKKLRTIYFGLFADKTYLAAMPPIATPDDLQGHILFSQAAVKKWTLDKDGQTQTIDCNAKVACDSFDLLQKQIRAGLGVGILPLLPNCNVEGLVRVLPDWQLQHIDLSLIYYKNRGAVPTVKSMVDFLTEKLQYGGQ